MYSQMNKDNPNISVRNQQSRKLHGSFYYTHSNTLDKNKSTRKDQQVGGLSKSTPIIPPSRVQNTKRTFIASSVQAQSEVNPRHKDKKSKFTSYGENVLLLQSRQAQFIESVNAQLHDYKHKMQRHLEKEFGNSKGLCKISDLLVENTQLTEAENTMLSEYNIEITFQNMAHICVDMYFEDLKNELCQRMILDTNEKNNEKLSKDMILNFKRSIETEIQKYRSSLEIILAPKLKSFLLDALQKKDCLK